MPTCRSCGAELLWAKTPSGKSMPLDASPVPHGNIVIDAEGRTGPAGPADAADLRTRYVSHFATCPWSGQHRKKA